MQKKPRFNPEVTRVKLNPEQAVLTCNCYDVSYYGAGGTTGTVLSCERLAKNKDLYVTRIPGASSS